MSDSECKQNDQKRKRTDESGDLKEEDSDNRNDQKRTTDEKEKEILSRLKTALKELLHLAIDKDKKDSNWLGSNDFGYFMHEYAKILMNTLFDVLWQEGFLNEANQNERLITSQTYIEMGLHDAVHNS